MNFLAIPMFFSMVHWKSIDVGAYHIMLLVSQNKVNTKIFLYGFYASFKSNKKLLNNLILLG